MPDHDFSSWPREQEASFVVYERKTSESARSAMTVGAIVGAVFFVIAFGIYVGVEPENKDMTKGMDFSNLTKKNDEAKKADAPKPEAPKAEAPKAEAPKAEAPDKPADKPADKPDGSK